MFCDRTSGLRVSTLSALELLKRNIDALLNAREQDRNDLARYCRRTRSWLDKALGSKTRGIPAKYLDRIADFFGLATYQLFQPGIAGIGDRRSKLDRRTGRDRRISAAVPLSQRPGDVDLMDIIRALSRNGREKGIAILADILNDEIQHLRSKPIIVGGKDRSGGSGGSTPAPARAPKSSRSKTRPKNRRSQAKSPVVPEVAERA